MNLILVLGAALEGFRGTLENRRRVGRVGRRVDSARSERMRAKRGKLPLRSPILQNNRPNPEGHQKFSLQRKYTGIAALRQRRLAPLLERWATLGG